MLDTPWGEVVEEAAGSGRGARYGHTAGGGG